jgi:uncharacterized protein YwqG
MNALTEPMLAALQKRIASEPDLASLDLMPLVRPSVRLMTQRVSDDQLGIGESRIGGVPDVPPGFEWPRWAPPANQYVHYLHRPRPDGPAPLAFIAQIDLGTIPQVDDSLPNSGWFYFFYDRYSEPEGFRPSDRGCCRVIYANPDRSTLSRAEPPSDMNRRHVAEPCRVEASAELTLPYNLPDLIPNFKYSTAASTFENIEKTPEYAAFVRLCDELMPGGETGMTHRLFGYPNIVQNPMELECQMASKGVNWGRVGEDEFEKAKLLETGAADWRLLLQIDTDEEGPGWMWGDCGKIYFWIKQQDLKSLRFDDVWLILQCSQPAKTRLSHHHLILLVVLLSADNANAVTNGDFAKWASHKGAGITRKALNSFLRSDGWYAARVGARRRMIASCDKERD